MKFAAMSALIVGWLMIPFFMQAAEQPKRGGTLTMATRGDMVLLNPLIGTRSVDKAVRDLMFESLLGLDLKGNVQSNLAESWQMSKDARLYTLKLRKGVRFHDGRLMTSADVKFAVDYTLNPKNGAYGLTELSVVDRVETPDANTVVFRLKDPAPAFLYALASIRSFSVVPKDSLQEGVDKPATLPPGTGPFRFVEWAPQQRIVLDRFADYWGPKAFLDRLVLRPIRDPTVRFTALRAGDVDMIETTPLQWVKKIADGEIKGLGLAAAERELMRRIIFNLAAPPFDNLKLRLAVAHAIDKKEFIQAPFFGFGEPTDQKHPKGHVWHIEGVPFPAYDPNRARTLLKESGYQGQTLELLIDQDNEPEATVLQAHLKRIGMNVKILAFDTSVYRTRSRSGEFAFRLSGGSFYADPSTTYAPDLACETDRSKRASNFSGYCNPEVDALFKSAEREPDPAKRKALFKQILTRIAQDSPEVYAGYGPRFFTFRDYVKGFTLNDEGDYRWWGGGLNHTWLEK